MEKDLQEIEKEGEELVMVDGTKMKVSGQVLKTAEEMRKRTMVLKVPKNVTSRSNSAGSGGSAGSKRRRAGTVEHCDYLSNKVNMYADTYRQLNQFLRSTNVPIHGRFLILNFLALPKELPTGEKAERGPAYLTCIVPGRGARRTEGDGRGATVLATRQLQESSRLPRQGKECDLLFTRVNS